MKSNFLKTVLPAFALLVAITASLAFIAPTEDQRKEDIYIKVDATTAQQVVPTASQIADCDTDNTGVTCTIFVMGQGTKGLWLDPNGSNPNPPVIADLLLLKKPI